MALALEAKARGHDVRLVVSRGVEALPAAFGFDCEVYPGRPVDEEMAGLNEGLSASRRMIDLFCRFMDVQSSVLPAICDGADLLLGNAIEWAAPSVAEHAGIPFFRLCLSPPFGGSNRPVVLPLQTMPPFLNRFVWGWIDLAGGLVALRPLNRARTRLGLPRVASFSSYLDESGYSFLAVDERLAPAASEWPRSFEYTGYPFLDQDLELPGDIRSFVEAGEKAPIYVGFGSMGNTNPEATKQMLLEALDASGSRALMSEGWAGLGGVSLPESVLLVKEVSHAALFPRLSGVVHHGGAGTTHTAARAGVPQLLLPHITDQFFWARSVLLEGLGPQPIPASRVDARSLATRLAELGSAPLRENAREFSNTMATRGAQTLVERLEQLALE